MSRRNYIEGFFEIPIVKLKHHYFINESCDIIHIKDKNNPILDNVYIWDTNTKHEIIKIYNYEDKKDVSATPIELYMITFYGYLPFGIKSYFPSEPSEYYYKIPQKTEIDSKTIMLGNIKFKKSSFFPNRNIYVSDDGCIYDEQRDRIMRQRFKYKEYNYRCYGTFKIHQIVYDAWAGNFDPEKEIHHKDNNEWNNDITNLQQLTRAEHVALHNYTLNDKKKIIQLCELMCSGMSTRDAAKEVGISYPIAGSVRRKEIHKDISYKYDFPEVTNRGGGILSDEQVHEICKLLEDGEMRNQEIAKMFNVNSYTIQDIRKGVTWRRISDEYNFIRESNLNSVPAVQDIDVDNYKPKAASITVDQVKEIWKRLQNNDSMQSISKLLNISYSIVKKIKDRSRWTKVTDTLGPLPEDKNKSA